MAQYTRIPIINDDYIQFSTEARDDHMHGLTNAAEIDDRILPHVPRHFNLQQFVDFAIFILLCAAIYYCWSVLPVGLVLYIAGIHQNPRTMIVYQTLLDMNHETQAEEQHDDVIDQLIDPPTDNVLVPDSIEPDDDTRIRLNNEDDHDRILNSPNDDGNSSSSREDRSSSFIQNLSGVVQGHIERNSTEQLNQFQNEVVDLETTVTTPGDSVPNVAITTNIRTPKSTISIHFSLTSNQINPM